jgi:hypothetical protein
MARKSRPDIILRDFTWFRDPRGYRLGDVSGAHRVCRSGASPEVYRPFEHENVLGEFGSIQSPDGLLDFVQKFGPLTEEGMDESKGENVATALEQARLISQLLRAAQSEHYQLDMPSEPRPISLTVKVRESGSEGRLLNLQPKTLLDAIWLLMSQVLAGYSEIRHCLHCRVWFAAGGQSGRRQDAKFCSDEHRIAYNNERRAAGKR